MDSNGQHDSGKEPHDLSGLDEPLRSVRESVDLLHGILDGFVNRRTSALTGDTTRDRLHDALSRIDEQLDVIDELRAADAPHLRGRVTASSLGTLAQAKGHFDGLNGALYRTVFTDRHKNDIPSAAADVISVLLGALRDDLDSLDRQLRST